jgi:hypothetical protein
VVRRPTDNIDYPLKLPRCEFGHNLLKGAGFADQQQRRCNRFGYFHMGGTAGSRCERVGLLLLTAVSVPGGKW